MAKKILASIVILIATMFLLGNGNGREYQEHVEYVMVGQGDTMDGIAGDFYGRDKRGVCWDEFRYEIWKLNDKLRKNGRCLQPGDIIEIRYYD